MTGTDTNRARLRDLGITVGSLPIGPLNGITDVAGVEVGHFTLPTDTSEQVRSGITAVLPTGHENLWQKAVFGGSYVLNGYGEMTGRGWLEEAGVISSPLCLTSYYAVGAVHEGLNRLCDDPDTHSGTHPIVAETWDGWLNDPSAFAIRPEHVSIAVNNAGSGLVEEGCIGGGTGMVTHDFKAGIGTSSRVVEIAGERYTVGVLVQANYGDRADLRVDGVEVGKAIPHSTVPVPERKLKKPVTEDGSIVVVIATDAPLLPKQCERLSKRGALGLGRVGGFAHAGSGDYFLSFSTANQFDPRSLTPTDGIRMLADKSLDPLFHAVVEATEESILNSLCAAKTMVGYRNRKVHAIPLNLLKEIWNHNKT